MGKKNVRFRESIEKDEDRTSSLEEIIFLFRSVFNRRNEDNRLLANDD